MDAVERLARAVLYEGYLLWPYRRSALKNRQRWTFGGVFPRCWSEAGHPDDAWLMRTEVPLNVEPGTALDVELRFLQVTHRQALRTSATGDEPVDTLVSGDDEYLTWDEATERSVGVPSIALGERPVSLQVPLDVPGGQADEIIGDSSGGIAGRLRRTWEPIAGTLRVTAEPCAAGVTTVAVEITNTTPWTGTDRAAAIRQALVSAHTVLRTVGGGFVSITDPPAKLADVAARCRNVGSWPVLVGPPGDRSTMLSSPIILEDYPAIAAESPGDLFDGGEIDQLLILNVLSLTDEEKREMRASDPRAREILDRCASLTPEQIQRLHGTVRELRPAGV